ncbi:Hypothetical protein, putative [Bodo saltans]|uniref:Uncharacterized protein n=1 Tax=Bodo saltans TaxID=75058 RepID=A0A0S4KHR8_BODSA|nr:Hypothetical protein, putative [Bodo saltans]|eukprot:CUI14079.1 Hypothetical protein, putative [Bodo saltans]
MSTSPRQTRTSIVAPLPVHPLQRDDSTCTNLKCPFRQTVREEELRCSRLGAANQVLRDAQQFLLAKCEAAAEHSNMLGFELEALRKEREDLLTSLRSERIHFEEQREDLNRKWEHIGATEEALAAARKQLLISNQESSLLKDQLCSLQDAVNKLTERLSSQHRQKTPEKRLVAAPTRTTRSEDRPESAGRRGTTPPRVRALPEPTRISVLGGVRGSSPTTSRRTGTLFVDASEVLPANFYHSPQHAPYYVPSHHQDVDGNESEPRPQIGWAAEGESAADDAPPSAPQEASMHHFTPDRHLLLPQAQQEHIWHQTSISPAPLASPLTEYTRSMKAALERADYVSAGLSAALPRLSGRSGSIEQRHKPVRTSSPKAPSAFMRDYETYIRSHPLVAADEEDIGHVTDSSPQQEVGSRRGTSGHSSSSSVERAAVQLSNVGGNDQRFAVEAERDRQRSPLLQRSVDALRRYDVDEAGVSATMALRKFRDSTQFAYAPSLVPSYLPQQRSDRADSEGSNSPPPPPPPNEGPDESTTAPPPPHQADVTRDAPRRSQLPSTSGVRAAGTRPSATPSNTSATNSTLELLGLPQFRSTAASSSSRGNFGGNRLSAQAQQNKRQDVPSFEEQ